MLRQDELKHNAGTAVLITITNKNEPFWRKEYSSNIVVMSGLAPALRFLVGRSFNIILFFPYNRFCNYILWQKEQVFKGTP